MDFKIKIDLSSQSIINETPTKDKKKKRKENGEKSEKSKKKSNNNNNNPESQDPPVKEDNPGREESKKKKKKLMSKSRLKESEGEKPKVNLNSVISLTLPNNDNSKGDQAQKLDMITKKKPRHWEKRWVLIPNVFEFTKEIWLKKWVLVDGEEDVSDNNVRNNKK